MRALTDVNMQVNPSKFVLVCNGTRAKQKLWHVWRAGQHPMGLVVQPGAENRISTVHQSMNRVLALGLPAHVKSGLYGAKVGGITVHGQSDLRTSARSSFYR
eukprot:618361-Amphidinium_carterae.2